MNKRTKYYLLFLLLLFIIYLYNNHNINEYYNDKKNIFYIEGVGGLGNCLFQLITAIYYKEKYGGEILLKSNSNSLLYGTSNQYGKKKLKSINNNDITYDKTIFKKLKWYNTIPEPYRTFHVDFTNTKIIPKNENILIKGYCQHRNLYKEYLYKMFHYLNLEDENIINYIKLKYKNIDKGICIGIRRGGDYSHLNNNITKESYIKALHTLKNMNINIDNLFIISDVKNVWENDFNLQKEFPAIEIDEDDITQIYAGILCKSYILSESTFHLWITYLGTINNNKKIIIFFNNTLITKYNLYLENNNWIKIDK